MCPLVFSLQPCDYSMQGCDAEVSAAVAETTAAVFEDRQNGAAQPSTKASIACGSAISGADHCRQNVADVKLVHKNPLHHEQGLLGGTEDFPLVVGG